MATYTIHGDAGLAGGVCLACRSSPADLTLIVGDRTLGRVCAACASSAQKAACRAGGDACNDVPRHCG